MIERIVGILLVVALLSASVSATFEKTDIASENAKLQEIREEEVAQNQAIVGDVSNFGNEEMQKDGSSDEGDISNLEAEIVQENNNQFTASNNAQTPDVFQITGETIVVEAKEEREYFSADITFTSEFVSDGTVMPYALYTPSTINEDHERPLIVWLHGSGEVNVGQNTFFDRGLPATLKKWTLEGVDAYIICPQLANKWNPGRWNCEKSKTNLQALLDKFIAEHNVDTENIIVVGHSLGGQGALYMAHQLPQYFSRCVVMSGYAPGIENSEITIPTIGYVGTSNAGEDSSSISYMKRYFVPVFGEQNHFSIKASHGSVPKVAFNLDDNGNNRSDVIEWMLGELDFGALEKA